MFCSSCGKEIPDVAKFCPICGTKFAAPEAAPAPVEVVPAEAAPIEAAPVEAPIEAAPVEESAPVEAAPVEPAPEYQPAPQPMPTYQPAPEYQQAAYAAAAPAAPARQRFDIGVVMKKHGKLIGIIAAAVIVLILLIVIIGVVFGSGGRYQPIGTSHAYYVSEDHEVFMFSGSKQLDSFEVDLDGSLSDTITSVSTSADRSVTAILTADGALRVADGSKLTLVEEEFVERAYISSDGNAAVYLLNEDGERSLNIWKGGKSSLIAELEYPAEDDYLNYYFMNYTVSPDGSAVLFTQYDEDGDYITYGWNGGEPVEIDDNISPLFVSDGGKISYLANYSDGELFVYDSFKKEIARIEEYDSFVARTADGKSIMYVNEDEDTMIYSTSMKEPVQVANKAISLIVPAYTQRNLNSFDEVIAQTEDGDIYRYSRKGDRYEKTKLASGVYDSYRLSADGKQLLFIEDNELYVINTTTKKPKENLIYDKVGGSLYTTGDFRHIYFRNKAGELMYSKGSEDDAVEICDDYVSEAVISADGTLVFIVDDELFCSKKGGSMAQVDYPDEAEHLTKNGDGVIIVRYDDELYTSKNGVKFTKTNADLG